MHKKENTKVRTPIADFVKEYAAKEYSRFHMPGHKGQSFLGCEAYDITEVAGADALYEAEGIIAESEKNATKLFGTAGTFFSTEGSSQCIRAMLYLAVTRQKVAGRPYVIAARNVHKAFLYAAALVDFDVVWLYPQQMNSLCSCKITPDQLEEELKKHETPPAAVYLTSPDYLGGQMDLSAMAEICHRYGTILAVDNAHGAYLHFLNPSQHPMDLGADICCDSAHKTLPVLTGGAYLQISKQAPEFFKANAKQALALFGSTSPSYLTLASLDLCNAYLADGYKEKLSACVQQIEDVRQKLRQAGWTVEETEALKLTVRAPKVQPGQAFAENLSEKAAGRDLADQLTKGLTGQDLAEQLRAAGVECEYADSDYIVFMITSENSPEDLERLVQGFGTNPWNSAENLKPVDCIAEESTTTGSKAGSEGPAQGAGQSSAVTMKPVRCEIACSIREAIFASHERILVKESVGRICGAPTVGCPPAIPIVASGEVIDENALGLLEYYGISNVEVVKM